MCFGSRSEGSMQLALSRHLCCPAVYERRVRRRLLCSPSCEHSAGAEQRCIWGQCRSARVQPLQRGTCLSSRSSVAAGVGDRGAAAGTASPKQRSNASQPVSAKEAVEAGMEAFESGKAQEALELFQAALSLRPTQVLSPGLLRPCCTSKLQNGLACKGLQLRTSA